VSRFPLLSPECLGPRRSSTGSGETLPRVPPFFGYGTGSPRRPSFLERPSQSPACRACRRMRTVPVCEESELFTRLKSHLFSRIFFSLLAPRPSTLNPSLCAFRPRTFPPPPRAGARREHPIPLLTASHPSPLFRISPPLRRCSISSSVPLALLIWFGRDRGNPPLAEDTRRTARNQLPRPPPSHPSSLPSPPAPLPLCGGSTLLRPRGRFRRPIPGDRIAIVPFACSFPSPTFFSSRSTAPVPLPLLPINPPSLSSSLTNPAAPSRPPGLLTL